jgi:hypothetical protein
MPRLVKASTAKPPAPIGCVKMLWLIAKCVARSCAAESCEKPSFWALKPSLS